MSNKTNSRQDKDLVGELIRRAGRREQPSPAEHERVFAAASATLSGKIRQRKRRVFLQSIAAVLLVGVAVTVTVMNLPGSAVPPLASVDRIVGPAEVFGADNRWAPLDDKLVALQVNSRIRTGPNGRLGLQMTNGVSLRMAEATEIEFTGPGHIWLVAGKVYADSESLSASNESGQRRILIESDVGLAWDIGTQFEVQYLADQYRLRVREGRVNLQHETAELQSRAGEQLTIDAERGVHTEFIARDNAQWEWTETVAPDPIISGRPVAELLEWVARQTGRSIEYAGPEVQSQVEATILYGQVSGLTPLETLDAMLATTDFDYKILASGVIRVDARPDK